MRIPFSFLRLLSLLLLGIAPAVAQNSTNDGFLRRPSQGTAPFGHYELATDFEQGKARVTQSGRNFVIDTDGDPVE